MQFLDVLVDGYGGGLIAADKGFIDQYQHARLAQHQGIHGVPPPRARMTSTHPRCLVRAGARWRKVVETVGSQWTEHFAVARIRVHDLWHFQQGCFFISRWGVSHSIWPAFSPCECHDKVAHQVSPYSRYPRPPRPQWSTNNASHPASGLFAGKTVVALREWEITSSI
jgi:hypothetical protein